MVIKRETAQRRGSVEEEIDWWRRWRRRKSKEHESGKEPL
jgi:hypothetical protein